MDNTLDVLGSLGKIFGLVFYVAIVLWTYKDARRRIDDPILIATAVAASMLPIVGALVYMLLRPPEYLADVRERELEMRAIERAMGRTERCPYCRSHIESDYLACPACTRKLREACHSCDKPLDPRWRLCPYCETEVRRTSMPLPEAGGRALAEPRRSREEPSAEPRRRRPATEKPPAREAPPRPKADAAPAKPAIFNLDDDPTTTARVSRNDAASIETEPVVPPKRKLRPDETSPMPTPTRGDS